jgi:DHA2 family multidrug resistance protein
MFVIGFVLLSTTQLLPQPTQTLLRYSAETSGFALALGGVATIGLMPIAGIIAGKLVSPRLLLIGGLLETAVGLILQSEIAPDVSF